MALTLIYRPTIRRYRALVALGLPTSSSPPCQLAWRSVWLDAVELFTAEHCEIRNPLVFARRRELCAALDNCSWPWSSHRHWWELNAVPCVEYGVRMFRCVTTAPQHQTLSVWFCVPFAGRVAGYATSRLLQRNTCRTSCVSAQSTSVGSQCRRQTDTSIFSVWARHTNAARPTLAALSGTHCFQVSCAHPPMPARPGATVSFRLHPERRRFQPSPSSVVVILAASDPTYMAVHCRWSRISGCRKPPLEQSAARCHLSFNAVCFSNPPQNSSLFPIISFLTVFRFLVLHTVYSSGLAVFVLWAALNNSNVM